MVGERCYRQGAEKDTEITGEECSWQGEQECKDLGKGMTEVCATNKKVCDTRREGKGGNNRRVGKIKESGCTMRNLGRDLTGKQNYLIFPLKQHHPGCHGKSRYKENEVSETEVGFPI